MTVRYIVSALVVASSMLAGAASGQEYPSKLVRILTSAPGSTNDIVARMIAQGLSANLRQPVIVDNRGTLAAEVLARAEPDGHVLMFYGGSVYIKTDRLRALAVTTPKRSPLIPELPTIGETVPGYQFVSEIGMYAPGRTPAAIVTLLQREIVRVLQSADMRERLRANGIDVIGNSPQEYAAMIKADIAAKRTLLKRIDMLHP